MKFKIPQLNSFKDLIFLVSVWRLFLFGVSIFASLLVVRQSYSFPYVDTILIDSQLPRWVWGFANFDGVHYIRTAMWGYISEYSQAFFPLYPLMMSWLGVFGVGFEPKAVYLITGLVISFLSFLVGLFFYQKVVSQDYDRKIGIFSVWLLILFPTSFYFVSVYTEGLFFLLSCLSIFFINRRLYLYASIFISLATATRIIGVFLVGILIWELFLQMKANRFNESALDLFKNLFAVIVSLVGILFYMFYLWIHYNNPIYFLTAQPVFGAERQVNTVVLLPQVLYRYIKILLTVPWQSSQFFSAANEFIFTLFGIALLVVSFRKVRWSFWLFSFAVFLLPTLTGTLSSMPRYILMMFLLFPPLLAFLKDKKIFFLSFIFVIQIIFTFLFVSGFWIA